MFEVFILAVLLQQVSAPVKCPLAPLTEAQVLDLAQGGLPDGRIVQIVGTCHIGFVPSSELMDKLAQRGMPEPVLKALINDGYLRITMAQAREETASLSKRVSEQTKASNDRRDAELARSDPEYWSLREKAAQVAAKDEFEKEANYDARRKAAESAVSELDRRHAARRDQILAQYADSLTASIQPIKSQIAALRDRTYEIEAKPEWLRYDAEHDRLAATVDAVEYWFTVPNDKARELHGRWNTARIQAKLDEDQAHTRLLADPVAGPPPLIHAAVELYTGVPRDVVEEKERFAAAAAAEEKKRQRAVWVDENTRLMWTGQDNGSNVDWNQAVSYCRNLRAGEYTDWRLPELGELQRIFDPTQPSNIKGGIRVTGTQREWSATRFASVDAWDFDFAPGSLLPYQRLSYQLGASGLGRALCVRRVGE